MYNSILLHIPHSSYFIPYSYGDNVVVYKLDENLKLQTDTFTDLLFKPIDNSENINTIIFPYSRYYCDVERYWCDNNEPMSKFGQGAIYTKYSDGSEINRNQDNMGFIRSVYDSHHKKLSEDSSYLVKKFDNCLIIDCHSFNPEPLPFEDDTLERPDICIGTNPLTSEKYGKLINLMFMYFVNCGYSVKLNAPYSGSILPNNCANDGNLDSIMIEVNKKIYLDMNNGLVNGIGFNKLNLELNKLYDKI